METQANAPFVEKRQRILHQNMVFAASIGKMLLDKII